MLTILSHLIDAMLEQAHKDHPIETCGIIAGCHKTQLPVRLIPMHNQAQSTDFFAFSPRQQLQIWREMEERSEVPLVIFHSHTDSAAYPSRTDRELALEPNAHYVIISTAPEEKHKIRSFRIMNGDVTEERIETVASYSVVAA